STEPTRRPCRSGRASAAAASSGRWAPATTSSKCSASARVLGDAFGLRDDQVTILIHSGSRGLGHQVCTDYVKRMDAVLSKYGIELPDRQLSCAPASSPEGQAYLAAMAAAANFAWSNRQEIANRIRRAIARVLGREAADQTVQIYDVAHNVAKRETHAGREVLVHRKGATRAFPGQPVFIPGS